MLQHTATHQFQVAYKTGTKLTFQNFCMAEHLLHRQKDFVKSTHCNTLQNTNTICNTLKHTVTNCTTLQHNCNTTATRCKAMQRIALFSESSSQERFCRSIHM